MAPNVITDFEYVFSKTVIETCFNLQPCHSVEFRSSNHQKGTQSRLKLYKQVDDSIKFHLYVCDIIEGAENTSFPSDILIQSEGGQLQDNITIECENYVVENKGHEDSTDNPKKKKTNTLTSPTQITSSSNWSDSNKKVNTIAFKQLQELEMQKKKKRIFVSEDAEMDISSICETEEKKNTSRLKKKDVIVVNIQGNNTLKKIIQPFHEITSTSTVEVPLSESCNDEVETVVNETHQGYFKDASVAAEANKSQIESIVKTTEEDLQEYPRKVEITKITTKGTNIRSGRQTKKPSRFTQSMANECEIKDSLRDEKNLKHTESHELNVGNENFEESALNEGENIDCQLCDTKVKNRTDYYIHLSAKHSRNKKFNNLVEELFGLGISCGVCFMEFTSRKDFKEHTEESHGRNGTRCLKCEFCDKQLLSVKQKNEHIKTDHIREGRECLECGAKTKGVTQLKSHLKRIHPTSQSTYLCHLCPASFKVVNYLNIHISQVHTNNAKDTFKCSQCPRTFATDKYLKNHIIRVHRERTFVCPYGDCDKIFKTHTNLKRHVMLVHEATKLGRKFKCQQCGKAFKLKANMKEHILMTHLKKFNHVCSVCNMTFRRRKELEIHQKTLHSTTTYFAKSNFPGTSLTMMVPGQNATTSSDDKSVATFIVATPEILNTFGVSSIN